MRRFTHIYDRLYENYGPQGWWPLLKEDQDGLRCRYEPENSIKELNRQEQFEICVGAILTQNTNWNNAERARVSLAKSGNLDPNSLLPWNLNQYRNISNPAATTIKRPKA